MYVYIYYMYIYIYINILQSYLLVCNLYLFGGKKMFADTEVLKRKYTETRVLKNIKGSMQEIYCHTKGNLQRSLKNIKVTQKSYCFIAHQLY